ncbi:MAG: hypothetical protein K2K25_01585 [Muribaculaceae bacterium]|nr:hypothetical protein [Muribaculaceae bacterium]
MRKLLLAIGVIFSITLSLSAAKEYVPITIGTKGHPTKNTTVKRAPMYLSLEITYDDTTHVVEVISEEEINAQVYIKSEDGNILGYSSCLNSTFNVPSGFIGILNICIEGEEWTAVGEVNIQE